MNTRTDVSAAKNPHNSAWVSANAGSGKTHLLADRVTRLLLAGTDPAKILCLTYTKAAAAEMLTRLFDRLGTWALLDDANLCANLKQVGIEETNAETMRQARQLFAQALETPGGLKIQTIHSFCQYILARFPVEARVPARFSVLDERSASELKRLSRDAVLRRAALHDKKLGKAVAILSTRVADRRFADIVDGAISKAGRLREILAFHDNDNKRLFATLRKKLNVDPDDDEDTVREKFCIELQAERSTLEDIAHWLLSGSHNDRKLGENLRLFLTNISGENFRPLQMVFLTDEGKTRKRLATKKTKEAQPEFFNKLLQLCERVVTTVEKTKAAATAVLTEAIVTVAHSVLDEYSLKKRARATLDYDDLINSTRLLLEREGAAAWVLYKLDGGIKHILVDEAQDTSSAQWRIIRKLAEEFFTGLGSGEGNNIRTLFAVGDEKQSIYSFQGAVPEEFGLNQSHFRAHAQNAELNFSNVRLPVSRRSTKAILSFVDEVFATDEARDGLSSMGETPLHEPHRKDMGRVEVWPTVKPAPSVEREPWTLPVDTPPSHGTDIVLAGRIADRIASWIQNGTLLPGVENTRAITPGDIMILLRQRKTFAREMIRQLMERNIPVAGADRMVLLDQIAIVDLVSLGRFVLLPEDDLNLAALLKSPFIGFEEDDLYALAQPRLGRLWDELSARKSENKTYTKAHEFLTSALSQADYLPPFEFFAHILAKGVRKRILSRFGAEADDAIGEFLSLAQQYEDSHPPSLEGFLNWFSRGAEDVKRDMEQNRGSVRVMTVHGAKGLEANVVIVPDTTQIPDMERREGILYTDDCVFFGMPKGYETLPIAQAKEQARLREMREYHRLLYVALTRARDWLILCGYETKRGVHETAWFSHLQSAAQRIGKEETNKEGEKILVVGAELSTKLSSKTSVKPKISVAPLPSFLSAPSRKIPTPRHIVRPSDANRDILRTNELAPLSPLTDISGEKFRRGLLIHGLLAMLPNIQPDERAGAGRHYLASRGVDGETTKKLLGEVFAVLDHPKFSSLFGNQSRGEVAITAELRELGNSIRINGQIDRLAVSDTEVIIADFKTNRSPPDSAEKTPNLYCAQMALYRAAVAKIYPGKNISCVLIWTDGACAMRLPDSLLDDALEKISAQQTPKNLA